MNNMTKHEELGNIFEDIKANAKLGSLANCELRLAPGADGTLSPKFSISVGGQANLMYGDTKGDVVATIASMLLEFQAIVDADLALLDAYVAKEFKKGSNGQ